MTTYSKLKPKKVLFIATRQIGDVLVTTPLISKARELWPDAEFHFLGYRGKLDMLKGNPDIAQIIETSDRPGFTEYLSLFNRLFQRYDVAIVTQPSDRAYLYGLMAGGREGVDKTIDILGTQMTRTMKLLGARSLDELEPGHVKILERLTEKR